MPIMKKLTPLLIFFLTIYLTSCFDDSDLNPESTNVKKIKPVEVSALTNQPHLIKLLDMVGFQQNGANSRMNSSGININTDYSL